MASLRNGILLENIGTDNFPLFKLQKNGKFAFETPRAEKWVTISNDALSLMQLLDEDVEMLKGKSNDSKNGTELIPGEVYSLSIEPVEGVEFNKVYFRLYGIINDYKGINVDSVIVREVGIDSEGNITDFDVNMTGRRKFSIPPSMCKMFGIKYKPGFELWPINSGFEKVNVNDINEKECDIVYENMSTYPTSEIDGTIRKIILELHGFSPYNNSHIITPTGALIPTNDFISSLTVFTRQNISTDNGCAGFRIGDTLPFKIVGRDNGGKIFSICDDKHNIYLEVDLTKQSLNANTKDGYVGVAHTALDGKDVDDVIGVKWDESTDENKPKQKEKEMSIEDMDKVFSALDKHFSRMDAYMRGIRALDY